jgi:hypothetical protein
MLASNPLRNSRSVLVATMSRTWNLRCVLAVSLGRTRPGSGTSAQVIKEINHRPADTVMPEKTLARVHAVAPAAASLSWVSNSAGDL